MKTIIYTRVSSGDQAENGLSLGNQLERCKMYCGSKGMTDIEVITDEGVSGYKTDKRPGWVKMMSMIGAGEVGFVVTYSLSRFARNTVAVLSAIEKMNKNGVQFHSLTESIDTGSAAGKLFLSMVAAFSEFERNVTGERTKAVLDMKKKRGEALGSIPYGFRKEGKMLVVEPKEQEAIIHILGLSAELFPLRAISTQLADIGIFNRQGKPFHPQQISDIIKNAATKVG